MLAGGRAVLVALVVVGAGPTWSESQVATTPRAPAAQPPAPQPPPPAAQPPAPAPEPGGGGTAVRLGRPYPAPVPPPTLGPPPEVYISIVPSQQPGLSGRSRSGGAQAGGVHPGTMQDEGDFEMELE